MEQVGILLVISIIGAILRLILKRFVSSTLQIRRTSYEKYGLIDSNITKLRDDLAKWISDNISLYDQRDVAAMRARHTFMEKRASDAAKALIHAEKGLEKDTTIQKDTVLYQRCLAIHRGLDRSLERIRTLLDDVESVPEVMGKARALDNFVASGRYRDYFDNSDKAAIHDQQVYIEGVLELIEDLSISLAGEVPRHKAAKHFYSGMRRLTSLLRKKFMTLQRLLKTDTDEYQRLLVSVAVQPYCDDESYRALFDQEITIIKDMKPMI